MAVEQLEDPLLGGRCKGEREALEKMKSLGQFVKEVVKENKRLWYLAGPAIFTSLAQYSLGATTQVFAGQLTTLALDAVSTENMVIAGLAFGLMLSMGSALEKLCDQSFGAKRLHMLGVYMQRSWVILTATCLCLLPIYLFATPLLRFLNQDEMISELAGTLSLCMIPQLFADGLNFPIQKFLQAQSKVMIMAVVSAAALASHIFLSWLLIVHFQLGLVGAAASLNIAWWILVLGQFAYIAMGYCPGAWTGFIWGALRDLGAFARLSIGSAIMMCLEFWFYMFLILLVGKLKNAVAAVAAVSICFNLFGWELMVFFGFNAAISVRISNELGAGRPKAAKFSILGVIMSSILLGLFFFALVLVLKNVYGLPFANSPTVVHAIAGLATVFAFTLLLNSVQPVLTGVAVGAGWQWLVAYINLGCYYVVGIPIGYRLASKFDLGVKGMWTGMLSGVALQTLILIGITLVTDWNKEAKKADSQIKKWGGSVIDER
uniref:Protein DETOXIFICATION n=2 Tax=Elaeis guineensis var. tenera TaxID=51953 RepID=A0A6I9SCA2_ELAGV|nr:protein DETOXIFICATION 33-like [Elaeis guineensis]